MTANWCPFGWADPKTKAKVEDFHRVYGHRAPFTSSYGDSEVVDELIHLLNYLIACAKRRTGEYKRPLSKWKDHRPGDLLEAYPPKVRSTIRGQFVHGSLVQRRLTRKHFIEPYWDWAMRAPWLRMMERPPRGKV